MRRKRRNHSPEFKAKVALAAIQGDLTMAELVKKFDVHANQITDWKKQLLSNASDVFGKGAQKAEASAETIEQLHSKIGQLTDADRLSLDPVVRQVGGRRAVDAKAASASQMGQCRCLWRLVRISLAAPLHLVTRENIHICAACHFKVNEPEYSRQNTKEPPSKAALYRFK